MKLSLVSPLFLVLLQSLPIPTIPTSIPFSIPAPLFPIILIPGQSCNQLEARLTDSYRSRTGTNCSAFRTKDWYRIWLNYTDLQLGPDAQKCFAEQMSLVYDSYNDDYVNFPGVETRVPFFGSTDGFRYRDPDLGDNFMCMARLVNQLETIGYQEGQNLFGAPYDFRYSLAAPGHPSKVGTKYLNDLKRLVEKASRMNENKPVILLSHSLGGLFALHFLNNNSMRWRQKFVRHFIALSTPWGGTAFVMQVLASGSTLNFPSIDDPLILRQEIRSLASDLWLLPSPLIFGEKPLFTTKYKYYSASNIVDFLQEIGFRNGIPPYTTRIEPLVSDLPIPTGVSVTCITGYGIDTVETLFYDEYGFDFGPSRVLYGDGDGLVNSVSLFGLESVWSTRSDRDLKVVKLENVSHEGILKDEAPLREVIKEVNEVNSRNGGLRFAS
ncbi:hypothetical protein LUZ60_006043 [Juncus effusus]|nr:hypothetical protein LUZ60_006043 [Juncus effusus]